MCAVARSKGGGSALPPLFEGVFKTQWGKVEHWWVPLHEQHVPWPRALRSRFASGRTEVAGESLTLALHLPRV